MNQTKRDEEKNLARITLQKVLPGHNWDSPMDLVGRPFMATPISDEDKRWGILIGTISSANVLPHHKEIEVTPSPATMKGFTVKTFKLDATNKNVVLLQLQLESMFKAIECEFVLSGKS
jgi:hypothetical protein